MAKGCGGEEADEVAADDTYNFSAGEKEWREVERRAERNGTERKEKKVSEYIFGLHSPLVDLDRRIDLPHEVVASEEADRSWMVCG